MLALALAGAVLAGGGCARGGSAREAGGGGAPRQPSADRSVPTFPPAVETPTAGASGAGAPGAQSTSTSTARSASSVPAAGGQAPTTTAASGTAPPPAAALTSSLQDPVGDASPSLLDKPPAWADLVAGRLTRSAEGFELRVRLGGPSAPTSSGDEDHTMNVASFFDVDGDGRVDYEVWANLDSGGWGSAYFDDVRSSATYRERSGIQVGPDGDEVVLRFPLTHLGSAASFRWSLALEWARYETLGSPTSVKDQAPDGGAPAPFPS
jgi:hypothetical protein